GRRPLLRPARRDEPVAARHPRGGVMTQPTTELAPATTDAPNTTDEAALLAWLARMRDEAPVWRDRYGMYHVFRHADVHTVLRDPATFSSDSGRILPAARSTNRGMLTQIDPPEH